VVTAWFVFLALMITAYVVLDGWDLGVGALHRLLGRTEAERGEAIAAIGPVWNGNEVWLIAAGGVLFLAFPRAYAAAFSGLYLGLIVVLWLLIGRGLGIELRHQLDNPLWRTACDTVFWLTSAALAFVLGAALGNVIRGVPLGPDGYFHLPLFEILNPYALLLGAFTVVLLCAHGTSFLAVQAAGPLAERARRWVRRAWWMQFVLVAALVYPTFRVRETMLTHFGDRPWLLVLPALTVCSMALLAVWQRAGVWGRAFAASCALIAGLLATAAAGMYPDILPAREGRPYGLTADAAASSPHALKIAVYWWPLGMALAALYFAVSYRLFFRRRRPDGAARITAGG
jgi:cytochrome d ubiquinol oxidase subunit II